MEVVNNALRVASRNFSAYLRSRAQFSSAVCRLELVSQILRLLPSLCHMLDSEFRLTKLLFERHKAKPQKPRFYMFFSALTKILSWRSSRDVLTNSTNNCSLIQLWKNRLLKHFLLDSRVFFMWLPPSLPLPRPWFSTPSILEELCISWRMLLQWLQIWPVSMSAVLFSLSSHSFKFIHCKKSMTSVMDLPPCRSGTNQPPNRSRPCPTRPSP